MAIVQLKLPRAQRVTDLLLVVVMVLIGLSLFGQCSKYLLGHPMLKGFVPMFYVDNEPSAPTWYSSAALGFAGFLLALISAASFQLRDRFRWHWVSLTGLLVLLSADEIAMLHELPIDPLRERFHWGGVLYYAWVLPGMVFVGGVGMIYLRFLLNLPRQTQRLFVLSAFIFVLGAIGVEMLSGVSASQTGEETFDYALLVTIEEFLEMLGVVVLIRALLEYIEGHLGGLRISFVCQERQVTPTRDRTI